MDGPRPSGCRARTTLPARCRQCREGRSATRNQAVCDGASARASAQEGSADRSFFTEYRDTLLHLRSICHGLCCPSRGSHPRRTATALEQFASGRHPILLATDAAGEGLNLHHGCRVVINLELPWNPMRLEQRIGRVDRIGQRRTVHAFHLIASETAEMRILERLKERIAGRGMNRRGRPLARRRRTSEQTMSRLVVAGDDRHVIPSAPDEALPTEAVACKSCGSKTKRSSSMRGSSGSRGSHLGRPRSCSSTCSGTGRRLCAPARLRSALGFARRSSSSNRVWKTPPAGSVASHLPRWPLAYHGRTLRHAVPGAVAAVSSESVARAMIALDPLRPRPGAWTATQDHDVLASARLAARACHRERARCTRPAGMVSTRLVRSHEPSERIRPASGRTNARPTDRLRRLAAVEARPLS